MNSSSAASGPRRSRRSNQRRAPAPPDPVPALQGDPVHPAGLLPHRFADPPREIGPRRDQPPFHGPHSQEPRPHSHHRDIETEFVILGQRIDGERPAPVAQSGDIRQRIAPHRAADPCTRNARPERIANGHGLGMRLAEFVDIMTRDEG